ncbi:MAG: iron-containing redox enzyme family protein [Vibrio sp.]
MFDNNLFEENTYDVAQRKDEIIKPEIKKYLNTQIDKIMSHRSVHHPFLLWYSKTKLTSEEEKILYLETYTYFKYLPFYVANISTITRDENVLREVLHNSLDELGKKKSHSDIYNEFLAMIGITQEDCSNYQPMLTSIRLNQGICKAYNTKPIEKALGAIFADETQSAKMCYLYNEGLKNQGYDKRIRFFWELHIEAEVGHSNSIFNVLSQYVSTEKGRHQFEAGIDLYLNLMGNFWDSIDQAIRLGRG